MLLSLFYNLWSLILLFTRAWYFLRLSRWGDGWSDKYGFGTWNNIYLTFISKFISRSFRVFKFSCGLQFKWAEHSVVVDCYLCAHYIARRALRWPATITGWPHKLRRLLAVMCCVLISCCSWCSAAINGQQMHRDRCAIPVALTGYLFCVDLAPSLEASQGLGRWWWRVIWAAVDALQLSATTVNGESMAAEAWFFNSNASV